MRSLLRTRPDCRLTSQSPAHRKVRRQASAGVAWSRPTHFESAQVRGISGELVLDGGNAHSGFNSLARGLRREFRSWPRQRHGASMDQGASCPRRCQSRPRRRAAPGRWRPEFLEGGEGLPVCRAWLLRRSAGGCGQPAIVSGRPLSSRNPLQSEQCARVAFDHLITPRSGVFCRRRRLVR